MNINSDISWFEGINSFVNYVKNSNIGTNQNHHIASLIKNIRCYDKMIGKSGSIKNYLALSMKKHFILISMEKRYLRKLFYLLK